MQDMLRELFKKNGYRVLVMSDPERALDRFFQDHKAADVVLFTTGTNGRAALDAFNRFGQESTTRDLPAVLLLDQNHAPLGRASADERPPRRRQNAHQNARPPRSAHGSVAEEGVMRGRSAFGCRRLARFLGGPFRM